MEGTGSFFHQHDVDILDSHRISIFNNNFKNFVNGDVVDGNNEVVIYDFKTNEYSSYLKKSLIEYDVRTNIEGLSQILSNGDLLLKSLILEEPLYFNANGSLRWSHLNRANNGMVNRVGWSRILYTKKDLEIVNSFLRNRENCNE